ncbi:MAG: ABC transporter permease [Proteobacteria bacterium]|nr:ABC transporter permease [Pseudomonadota bacterium]
MHYLLSPKFMRSALPGVSLAILLMAIFYIQPRAMSYFGLNLMLQYTVPIALATIAQMFILTVNDLDLSIGPFVGLTACIGATLLQTDPVFGILALLVCIAAYAGLGALIYWRNLPSIVVTLGMSFVWLGVAVLILPTPGGTAPAWIKAIMGVKLTYQLFGYNIIPPFPVFAAAIIAILVHLGLMRSSYGVVLRGAGGNPRAISRAGWSMLKIKMTMFALAGLFGVLAGLSLIGLTSAADAHIADRYTLYSIAGVILGGGEFVGGRVSPAGAVIGAMTLTLAGSFLIFLRISPDWQVGAQGGILILVLALRALINWREAR